MSASRRYGPEEATWADVRAVDKRTQRVYRSARASRWAKFRARNEFSWTYQGARRTTLRETRAAIARTPQRTGRRAPG